MPRGVYKHKPFSEEHKKKLSEAKLKNPVRYWLGKKLPSHVVDNLRKVNTGKVISENHRKKISKANKNKKLTQEHINKISGENNWQWKGMAAKYGTKHDFVERVKGKANICSFDPLHKTKRYAWANISGSYLRDIDDYVSLCSKCHRQYDIIRNGYINIGKKGVAYKNYKEVVSIWTIR